MLNLPHPLSPLLKKIAITLLKYSVMRILKNMKSFADTTGAFGIHTNCCVGLGKKESDWKFNRVSWLKEESQSCSGILQAGTAAGVCSASLPLERWLSMKRENDADVDIGVEAQHEQMKSRPGCYWLCRSVTLSTS